MSTWLAMRLPDSSRLSLLGDQASCAAISVPMRPVLSIARDSSRPRCRARTVGT